VGDTGSGKSSLLNAVLGHPSLLPTSGMRACTAVVVEITNNKGPFQEKADEERIVIKVTLRPFYRQRSSSGRFNNPSRGGRIQGN
jgi:Fe-S cluster assembly ATPase SufC